MGTPHATEDQRLDLGYTASSRWLRLAALGGLATFVFVVLVEHLLAPGLAPVSHEISEYANDRTGPLMTIGFAGWSASLVATAALVRRCRLAWNGRARAALPVLLLLAGGGLAVTAAFHTQTSAGKLPPGVRLGTAGRLHDLGSGLTTLALLASVAVTAMATARPNRLRVDSRMLLLLAVATDAVLLPLGQDFGGLRQRVLVAAACVWQAGVAMVSPAGGGGPTASAEDRQSPSPPAREDRD